MSSAYSSVAAISSEWCGDGDLGAEPLVRGSGGRSQSNLEIAASNTSCNEALLMSFAHGLTPGV